jgi:tRNA (guanine6-N2)-methyltransferase
VKPQLPTYVCEAEVAEGLEAIACDELRCRLGARVTLREISASGRSPRSIRFEYTGDLGALLQLHTVLAVYLIHHAAVPRPRALLGDEHFRALLAQIALVRSLLPSADYRTLGLSAAGSGSPVLRRLTHELAQHSGLAVAMDKGDLYVRLRRPPDGSEGWEVVIRLTPRPLSTRSWRVRNPQGALNATVAHAMVLLTRPTSHDVFLNIACGSGALLIERLLWGSARRVIGCDISAAALEDASANVAASGHSADVELYQWDARALPLPGHSVDALCSMLPFGHKVGSHDENLTLYPQILQEAARVAKPGRTFVLLTHEIRLMASLLEQPGAWTEEKILRVCVGGLYPRIYVLRRRQSLHSP